MSACPVCLTLVGQAILIIFLCSVFIWPVCHVLKGQKNGHFPLSHLPVPDGTDRRAIFKVLSACPSECYFPSIRTDSCICLTLFSIHVILLCIIFCCFCVLCIFLNFTTFLWLVKHSEMHTPSICRLVLENDNSSGRSAKYRFTAYLLRRLNLNFCVSTMFP